MNTADLIRMEIKRHTRPGKPVDTDTLIEALAATMDILAGRISRLEQQSMKDEA